jgi:hypothetical protein
MDSPLPLLEERADVPWVRLVVGYVIGVLITVLLSLPLSKISSLGLFIFLPIAFAIVALVFSPQLLAFVVMGNFFLFPNNFKFSRLLLIVLSAILIPLLYVYVSRFFAETRFGSLVPLEIAICCLALQLDLAKRTTGGFRVSKRLTISFSVAIAFFEVFRIVTGESGEISDLVPLSALAPAALYSLLAVTFENREIWLRSLKLVSPVALLLLVFWSRSFSVADGFAWVSSSGVGAQSEKAYEHMFISSAFACLVFAVVWELASRVKAKPQLSN